MPPKILAKSERAGGVLPVNAAARAAAVKQPAARLKLEIRRLPPSLTLTEFEETLGEDWKLGKGKIDWREYRQGKIKSPGKLPEQSRCYVHVVNEAAVKEFEQRFLAVVFHDKAGTHKHVDVKHLPPTLGYAPNQRVPTATKQRGDNRQGTIDQDPEFIAFLEAETQAIPKAAAIDSASAEREEPVKEQVKSTPLIDDLREKKANKAKAAASKAEKKNHNRSESKDANTPSKETKTNASKVDAKKVEQAAKQAVKVVKKQAQNVVDAKSTPPSAATTDSPRKKKGSQPSPKPAASTTVPATTPASPSPAAQRVPPAQRQRRDAEGIKKMLQKDLGIKPKDGAATPPSKPRAQASSASTPAAQSKAGAVRPPPTTPAANTTKVESQPSSQPTSPPPNNATPATTTPPQPKAFLKHANPSQGMTEELIKEALTQFGPVQSVNIDPRKGIAIAIFGAQEALQKAISAKKVPVANGAIEVLEYKDRSAGGARGGYRSGNRGRGGRNASSSVSNAASNASAPATVTTPAGS